jgi:hypothetical protein
MRHFVDTRVVWGIRRMDLLFGRLTSPGNEFYNEPLGPKFPLAIDPSHVARRFAAQRSRFTIFGRAADGLTKA